MNTPGSSRSANDSSPEPISPRVGDQFQAELPDVVSRSEYLLLGHSDCSGDRRSKKKGRKARKASKSVSEPDSSSSAPHSKPASWTDIEKKSFLLGLYIFLKNFALVAAFVETKSTCDVKDYYYGGFYNSVEYSRWSPARCFCKKRNQTCIYGNKKSSKKCIFEDKKRSRKCVSGDQIFTGDRLKELLARLSKHVSEDCKTALIQVSREFSKGSMKLQEYIFKMKQLVGLNLLVEAVGVGEGKKDLTDVKFAASRESPSIPAGKEYANLTVSQINEYLSGDGWKSKVEHDALFFGSVWPRLLARGWTSEKPKGPRYPLMVQTKPNVYLVPDAGTVSQRRLSQGVHFYESISDILSLVAKDPSLIVLDTDDEQKNTKKRVKIVFEEDQPAKKMDLGDRVRPSSSSKSSNVQQTDEDENDASKKKVSVKIIIEQVPSKPLRRGERSRAPTARALEAVADGFLTEDM